MTIDNEDNILPKLSIERASIKSQFRCKREKKISVQLFDSQPNLDEFVYVKNPKISNPLSFPFDYQSVRDVISSDMNITPLGTWIVFKMKFQNEHLYWEKLVINVLKN